MKMRMGQKDGFTLIEVIVAIVICMDLVAAFAPLIVSSVRNIQVAGQRTQVLYSIRGEMEKGMATQAGIQHKVTVRGSYEGGEPGQLGEWEVTGTHIRYEVVDEDDNMDEFLVSFVIPKY